MKQDILNNTFRLTSLKPKSEIFVVYDTEGPILYAPLRQLTARLNESAVATVGRFLYGKEALPEDTSVLETLTYHGFFEPSTPPQTQQINKPTEVTLFPSDGCNLRCRYCYASAEKKQTTLSFSAGAAAIDRVSYNAKELGQEDFVVGFHGNGEPTTAFHLVRKLCKHAQEVGSQLNLIPKLSMATNGVFGTEVCDYLIDNFSGINVSFDGLPDIQNTQRPLENGADSFPFVDATLQALDASNTHYGIRATITATSVSRLTEIAAFVTQNYPHCDSLNIEPAWEWGRCLQTNEKAPEASTFIEQFISARNICENANMSLVFSSVRTDVIHDAFCGVNNDGFTVTPEGLVTSCFEVSRLSDPRANTFIYGHFDEEQGFFSYNDETRAALHTLNVYAKPDCADCFCKFHCCGDCPAKSISGESSNNRCQITRALTLDALSRRLKAAELLINENPQTSKDKNEEELCLKTTA